MERGGGWQPVVGPVLLWMGLIGFGIALMDVMHSLPWAMPRIWYQLRPGCLLVAFMALLAGSRLVWGTTERRSRAGRDDDDGGEEDDDDDDADVDDEGDDEAN